MRDLVKVAADITICKQKVRKLEEELRKEKSHLKRLTTELMRGAYQIDPENLPIKLTSGNGTKVNSSVISYREMEVLEAVQEGLVNKDISLKLGIGIRTVKFHVSNLLAKFGAERREQLISLMSSRRIEQ